MAPKKHQSKKPKLLSHTRPPTFKSNSVALSAKATRNLIRSHHRLLKKKVQASRLGDETLIRSIDAQIQRNGGLESYQLASKLGQSLERGGDSSRVLIDWIGPQLLQIKDKHLKLRVLEVGALSTKNACSMHDNLDVTRIDLNSQESGILKQDFMQRPLPRDESERFHIISLSLVLNYVPDAPGRGEMLKRCVAFLSNSFPVDASLSTVPSLFLVLPLACVQNSRYLTEDRLREILCTMGFILAKTKETSKLLFQLWEHRRVFRPRTFKKELLNPGKTRNNFAIVVE